MFSTIQMRTTFLKNKVKLFEKALQLELKIKKTKTDNLNNKINLILKTRKLRKKRNKSSSKTEGEESIKLRLNNIKKPNKKYKKRNEKMKPKLYLKITKIFLATSKLAYKDKNAYLSPRKSFFFHLQNNAKNRRILFKKKPYSYKERKKKIKQWLFRINRKLKGKTRFLGIKGKKQNQTRAIQKISERKRTKILRTILLKNKKKLKQKKILMLALRKMKFNRYIKWRKNKIKELNPVGDQKPSSLWKNSNNELNQPFIMTKSGFKNKRKRIKKKFLALKALKKAKKPNLLKKKNFKKKKPFWLKKRNRGFLSFFDTFGFRLHLNYK